MRNQSKGIVAAVTVAFVGAVLFFVTLGAITAGMEKRSAESEKESEALMRETLREWERIWMLDMPDHMSPHRTHGGVI